jgi:hypothetical protein
MSIQGDVEISQQGIIPTAFAVGPSGAAALGTVPLDVTGSPVFGFDPSRPGSATLTAVASSTGSTSVLVTNTARRGVMLYNATNQAVNIALAATASTGAFSFALPSLGSYESPLNGYQGPLSAIWPKAPSAGPSLHVTEITYP